jgi:predicted kinase
MSTNMPTLTLFCGLPGSGKTRIAKQIEAKTGAIRVCTDDWIADIGANHFDEELREPLQGRLYRLAQNLLSCGVDVILEDGLWSKDERDEKLATAQKIGANIVIHVFILSPEELWRRIEHRNQKLQHGTASVTREQLEAYQSLFEPPRSEELKAYDEYVVYDDGSPLTV